MKKIKMLFLTLVLLYGCCDTIDKKEEPPKRIRIIETATFISSYEIIEVDGHQYLTIANHGGIIHLESCPCKNR